jgi:hypothetical protein
MTPQQIPIGSVVTSKKTGAYALVKEVNPDGSLTINLEDQSDRTVTLDMVEIFWLAPTN